MNALDYFLKANLYGLLFAGSYWLLLRRHTFFSLNRAYLLLSAALSLVLPLASLPTQTVGKLSVPVGVIVLPVATVATAPVETGVDWEQIGLIAYGLIALFLVIRFSARTARLLRLIRQSPRQVREGYVRVQPNDPAIPTFSFFGYMVLNPADAHNELIIEHERVHIRQFHSTDVMSMGLLRAVFWACPALWLIDRMLRQVHEFLADTQTNQPTNYTRFLIEYTFSVRPDTLTNGFFNPSLLKQRIMMLHQKATNRWALGKYVLVLPLTLGLLAMTTAREEISEMVNRVTDEPITVLGRVTSSEGKPMRGAIVMVANTGKGTPTDAQGRYKLEHVPNNAKLSVSFVGFDTQVIPVGSRKTLDVALAPTNPNELPMMGATAVYKAIKPNPAIPVRTPPSSETINGKVYTAVEEPAVFPTGIPGLMQYVAHTLRYPAKAQTAGIEGNVMVQFVVLPTGAIGSAKIKKGIGSGCDEEALRIVKQMPRWIPGRQNGKAVAVQFVIPIQFALDKKEDKRTGQVNPDIFKPTGSPIGEFSTARDVNYPNQPRLTTIIEPASFFTSDTTPQPKTGDILDNSKNGRSAFYNDVMPRVYPLPDSLKEKPDKKISFRVPNDKPPLYILDGVEISEDKLKTKLSPNDIESIDVIKGTSATATYGPKANYGAVIITSKKK